MSTIMNEAWMLVLPDHYVATKWYKKVVSCKFWWLGWPLTVDVRNKLKSSIF
jgi:hypothetical protein